MGARSRRGGRVVRLTHPDMTKRIRRVCRQRGLVLSRLHASLLGSLYRTFRPNKTAWQVARMMAATNLPDELDGQTIEDTHQFSWPG